MKTRPFCEAEKDGFTCNLPLGHIGDHIQLGTNGGCIGWRNTQHSLKEEIRVELERKVGNLSFGLESSKKANYEYWAELTVAMGLDAGWAIDWIKMGNPEPMEWLVRDVIRKVLAKK